MNKEFEFVGVPVSGPEEDYLLTSEQSPNSIIGMCDLLSQGGAQRITWQEATAFDSDNDHFNRYKKDYLEEHGRVPRVYKIKIQVEVEELSKEDCEAFWESKRLTD